MNQSTDGPPDGMLSNGSGTAGAVLEDELAQLEDALRREDSKSAARLYGRHKKVIRQNCGHAPMTMSVGGSMPFEYADPVERAIMYSCQETVSIAIAAIEMLRGQLDADRLDPGKLGAAAAGGPPSLQKPQSESLLDLSVDDGTRAAADPPEGRPGGPGALDSSAPADAFRHEVVLRRLRRFDTAAQALGRRRRTDKAACGYCIVDEYDVQDLAFALLKPDVVDLEYEDPIPKLAGDSGRVDLSSRHLGMIIELKYVRDRARGNEIAKECRERVLLYSRWPELRHLVFFVYDPNRFLGDPDNIIHGLSVPICAWGPKTFRVTTVVSPWEVGTSSTPTSSVPTMLPDAKPDPAQGAGEDTVVVALGATIIVSGRDAVVVPVAVSNRSDRPNTISTVALVVDDHVHPASPPREGSHVPGLDWLPTCDIRLEPWGSVSGAWYFGWSFEGDGAAVRVEPRSRMLLRVTLVRGGSEDIPLEAGDTPPPATHSSG